MSHPKTIKAASHSHTNDISTSLSSMERKNQNVFNRSSVNSKTINDTLNGTKNGKKSSQKHKKGTFRKWFEKLSNGKTDEDKANKEIENKLKSHLKNMDDTMSMLLLGAGGSGKSTVLKQMEKIHNGEMDEKQLNQTKNDVHKNITLDIYDLCKHYFVLKEKLNDIAFESSDIENLAIKISSEHDPIHNSKLDLAFAKEIKTIWSTDSMKRVFDIRKKSHIMDNTPYFMNKVEKYANPNYIPSFDDYVRIRDCTTGIIHSEFTVNHGNREWLFKITDVGGQRAERRKWLHVFSGIDVVIYVMSLSAYDQVLFEDHNTRCYDETLGLFNKTVSNKAFKATDFIVFLNKSDIFNKKIKQTPFTVYNANFPKEHAHNGNNVITWVKSEFSKRFYGDKSNDDEKTNNYNQMMSNGHGGGKRGLHFHVTCATDTNQIESVVRYVQIELIRKLMSRAALL